MLAEVVVVNLKFLSWHRSVFSALPTLAKKTSLASSMPLARPWLARFEFGLSDPAQDESPCMNWRDSSYDVLKSVCTGSLNVC
jgi:hypothetical protein